MRDNIVHHKGDYSWIKDPPRPEIVNPSINSSPRNRELNTSPQGAAKGKEEVKSLINGKKPTDENKSDLVTKDNSIAIPKDSKEGTKVGFALLSATGSSNKSDATQAEKPLPKKEISPIEEKNFFDESDHHDTPKVDQPTPKPMVRVEPSQDIKYKAAKKIQSMVRGRLARKFYADKKSNLKYLKISKDPYGNRILLYAIATSEEHTYKVGCVNLRTKQNYASVRVNADDFKPENITIDHTKKKVKVKVRQPDDGTKADGSKPPLPFRLEEESSEDSTSSVKSLVGRKTAILNGEAFTISAHLHEKLPQTIEYRVTKVASKEISLKRQVMVPDTMAHGRAEMKKLAQTDLKESQILKGVGKNVKLRVKNYGLDKKDGNMMPTISPGTSPKNNKTGPAIEKPLLLDIRIAEDDKNILYSQALLNNYYWKIFRTDQDIVLKLVQNTPDNRWLQAKSIPANLPPDLQLTPELTEKLIEFLQPDFAEFPEAFGKSQDNDGIKLSIYSRTLSSPELYKLSGPELLGFILDNQTHSYQVKVYNKTDQRLLTPALVLQIEPRAGFGTKVGFSQRLVIPHSDIDLTDEISDVQIKKHFGTNVLPDMIITEHGTVTRLEPKGGWKLAWEEGALSMNQDDSSDSSNSLAITEPIDSDRIRDKKPTIQKLPSEGKMEENLVSSVIISSPDLIQPNLKKQEDKLPDKTPDNLVSKPEGKIETKTADNPVTTPTVDKPVDKLDDKPISSDNQEESPKIIIKEADKMGEIQDAIAQLYSDQNKEHLLDITEISPSTEIKIDQAAIEDFISEVPIITVSSVIARAIKINTFEELKEFLKQSKSSWMDIFYSLDTKSLGSVSTLDSFRHLTKNYNLTKGLTSQILKDLDYNQDGFVTSDEWMRYETKKMPTELQQNTVLKEEDFNMRIFQAIKEKKIKWIELFSLSTVPSTEGENIVAARDLQQTLIKTLGLNKKISKDIVLAVDPEFEGTVTLEKWQAYFKPELVTDQDVKKYIFPDLDEIKEEKEDRLVEMLIDVKKEGIFSLITDVPTTTSKIVDPNADIDFGVPMPKGDFVFYVESDPATIQAMAVPFFDRLAAVEEMNKMAEMRWKAPENNDVSFGIWRPDEAHESTFSRLLPFKPKAIKTKLSRLFKGDDHSEEVS